MSGRRPIIRRAVGDAFPLFLPVIPFALVLGVAITESGIGNLVGWSSSSLVFGGAAQLTVVSLLGAGAAVTAAIVAALVVNARHLMYSAALAPAFQAQPRWFRWLGPYFLVDQLFALAVLRSDDDPDDFRTYYLAAGLTFWPLWQVSTAAGLVLGPVVPESWQLGFAVPVMFLGLVVMGINSSSKLVAAAVGAAVTFAFAGLPNRAGLLVGSLVGVVAGALAGRSEQ